MMLYTQQRKAFSMLTAVVVIVTMAVIAAFVTNLSGKTVKITTDQYRKEQAILYARSYTEYAIMAVSARDRTMECIDDINANIQGGIGTATNQNTGYRIRLRLSYIGNATITNCADTRELSITVSNPRTPLNIIVDAYVDYRDINNMNRVLTYHRRSLQKI
ncbi:MAG: Unknown protein [uncultured Sulfurovum sp.]|uniref:Type II secretion system protein n=1 Tax=uncultured Sulfurovum sp. TaxID=269237 RepID=A0A6S6U0I6_9BACT|nr:MAG: Unknown protein [uncultured Sulfurovum sp.]